MSGVIYSYTRSDGGRVENITDVGVNDRISVMMHDGILKASVEEVIEVDYNHG